MKLPKEEKQEMEKQEMIENAISSFNHGIEHLIKENNNDNDIKFSILHIFNALELITKAHLREINEALVWPTIDKKDDKKDAGIYILMKRMNQFSEYKFNQNLIDNVEKLRKKRNEIEHKKFIIENEQKLMKVLFTVIEETIIFSQKALKESGAQNKFIKKWKEEYVESYMTIKMNFDEKFKRMVEEIKEKQEKYNLKIKICNHCFLKTILFKEEEGIVKCLNCGYEQYYMQCRTCNRLFFISKDDTCSLLTKQCYLCGNPSDEEIILMAEDMFKGDEKLEKDIEEVEKNFKLQKFD